MISPPRVALYALLIVAFVLHQDFWLWSDSRMLLGLPIGLTYHVLYCIAAAGLLSLLVRFAWPHHLDSDSSPGADPT